MPIVKKGAPREDAPTVEVPVVAVSKGYVCEKFPSLSLHMGGGKTAQFRRGTFRTDDPEVQAKVEANDWYGLFIHAE